jgi:hypothetical protein
MSRERALIEVRLVKADEHAELKELRLSALAYSDHLVDHLRRESAAPPWPPLWLWAAAGLLE